MTRPLPNAYEEIEAKFRKMSRGDFAEWVASQTFAWKTWGDGPWDEVEAYKYAIIARAPGDPHRESRESEIARGKGYGATWAAARKMQLADVEKAILKATSDGRPRTLNRIAVETFGLTADIIPAVAELAVMRLVFEEKLAFAFVPAPYSVPDGSGRKRRRAYEYMLLWNDATWRKLHPEFPRSGRIAPRELPFAWEGARPLRGTAESTGLRQLELISDEP